MSLSEEQLNFLESAVKQVMTHETPIESMSLVFIDEDGGVRGLSLGRIRDLYTMGIELIGNAYSKASAEEDSQDE